MMRSFVFLLTILSFLYGQAQPKLKDRKYPSLLWEITGNGAKKPSYLIGTMHVSSKLAFHLPDSFYVALRNANVVALETNPETWQEDMSKYDIGEEYSYDNHFYGDYTGIPANYLGINTLRFYKYDSKIERSLYSNPSTINNLLYRSYGNESSDFEEDTYLDMYIFQCGKKWGKKVAGVEDYGESMKLMAEAYKDASKDKNKKDRSYDDADDEYSIEKLQEAYRSGNLDLLDSINRYNSFSDAFDEKFLYKRNEIQANNIDSIIRSGSVLFVGVGAAHLPGERGVIEMLRRKGFRVRPVKMGERASRDKDLVDKIRVPVTFRTEIADDGLYKVDIPGKFYKYGEDGALEQKQYADMANGSYYMVTRIMTNAWMWSHNTGQVYRTIDSLLYENIPGKIISKTTIMRNGYKGFDITNRTRRGDVQRYNIFITPFEIIFFKMSGNGEYVSNGEEARKFFGSIQLKEYRNSGEPTWKKYSPSTGGFSIDLPHEPYVGNDGSWIYDTEDKSSGTHYRIVRTDIHNYHFVEEDSFDLSLMDESFMASEFIDTQLSRRQTSYKGYPALDAKYRDKNGWIYRVRFIIQGPHYYTIMTHGKQETAAMNNFLNSFEIKPFKYGEARQQKDTSLYYTVQTPVYPEEKKIKIDMPRYSFGSADEDEDEPEDLQLESGAFRNKVIRNDSTGERIYVSFYRSARYYYSKDSSVLEKDNEANVFGTDSTRIVRWNRKTQLPNKFKVWETIISDTGSSRTLWGKTFYKDGIGFTIATQSDTLSPPSDFVRQFFDSFSPADTLKGINPFEKKSAIFFDDFMSADSALNKRAVRHIDGIELDAEDLPRLKQAIAWVNWNQKKYLDTKASLINKLGGIKSPAATTYLKELYFAFDDTIQLQYAVLENLLQQKTAMAYNVFRDIINAEPPVLEKTTSYSSYRRQLNKWYLVEGYDDGNFLDELTDSLKLTRTILPDLLPLLNLEDYKSNLMGLLGQMVDSSLVTPRDYDMYFSKFLIEARQVLKKQSIAEKKRAIEKAEENKTEKKGTTSYYGDDEEKDKGNDNLSLYAILLLPYWETNPQVQPLIRQMLLSNDRRLKYSTLLLMIKNNKPYPDSLLTYFGGLDEYRIELYEDLKKINRQDKFPGLYNNHLDLGRSSLLGRKTYGKPDSIVYLDRLKTEYKGKTGFVYFFKVKGKKDDLTWKLATVGLVPEDPLRFEFEDSSFARISLESTLLPSFRFNRFDFTGFTDTKLKEDEDISIQLKKALKKMLYSRRKSAKEFYEEESDRTSSSGYSD